MALTPGLGWTLLDKKVAANSASLIFTDLTGFDAYHFILRTVRPVTNGVNLNIVVSTDNGSSWDSAADYHYAEHAVNFAGAGGDAGGSAAQWAVMSSLSNSASTGASGEMTMIGLNTSLTRIIYAPFSFGWWTGTTHQVVVGQFIKSTAGANANAVKFQMSSGNIQDGDIKVYGIV